MHFNIEMFRVNKTGGRTLRKLAPLYKIAVKSVAILQMTGAEAVILKLT